MTSDDNQNNASDKGVDDSVQSGQGEQNTIWTIIPGANNEMIDHFRGGRLDKASVNYEYHSPDPTEAAQRLALINYVSFGKEKMVAFKPLNLLQIMSNHRMEIDDVALIAGTDSAAVESWFQDGVASESVLHNIACAVGVSTEWIRGVVSGEDSLKANCEGLAKELQKLPDEEIKVLLGSFRLKLEQCQELNTFRPNAQQDRQEQSPDALNPVYKNDSEQLISIYRLMSDSERQNLYRVVCLRHKELSAMCERYI